MPTFDIAALTGLVLLSAFGLAFVFGAVAQRTHFCTMGAIADVVSMGDWTRARMWALAVAVAIAGFNAMVALGWVEARHSIYAAPRILWLSALVGGAAFGFGMVLASGCGSKSLVRLGGGNLKSLVVLLMLGLFAMATLRGIVAVARVNTLDRIGIDLGAGQDLPTLIARAAGFSTATAAAWAGALAALAIVAWVLRRPEGRSAPVWLGGVGIGAVIVGCWWVSGRLGFVPEHPETLEPTFLATNSRRMESLSMVAPVGYAIDWLTYYSERSRVLTIGIVSMAGVCAGAFVAAVASKQFRWETFGGGADLANHLAGGALMGVGGVLALGCTIGQGISGLATLSLGSAIAVAGIVAGAVLALRWQTWRLMRQL